LVWKLKTTIAWHYMHTFKMKRSGSIKMKLWNVTWVGVKKTLLIPITHVSHSSIEIDGYWTIRNQCIANVEYKMKYPFTKYPSCTCEWALQGNFYKHQIKISLKRMSLSIVNIIWI
jgi:hypothetical protein